MKKSVKIKNPIVLLILFAVALVIILIFSVYPDIKSREKQTVGEEEYTAEEIIEPEEFIPEEIDEIPVIEESEEEVEVLNEVIIEITNLRFYPKDVTISPGTKATWVNKDNVPHKIVAYDRLFYSPRLNPGDSYSFIFTNECAHSYFDAVFPKIGRGKIIVKEEPLPITGGLGLDLSKEESDAKFALLFVLFIVMIFGLSHGIYKHKKI